MKAENGVHLTHVKVSSQTFLFFHKKELQIELKKCSSSRREWTKKIHQPLHGVHLKYISTTDFFVV